MARGRRRSTRRLPGYVDIHSDRQFLADIRALAANGEISHLDALRALTFGVVAKEPQRIADWAFRNLFVPTGMTTRPGPMKLTAMQGAICDLMQDPRNRQVTYLKNPRIGASFLIAAAMLYFSAHENDPTMFYERAMKNARTFCDTKVMPILRASLRVRDLLPDEAHSSDRQRWSDRTMTNGAGVRFRSVSDKIKSDNARIAFADEAGDPAYRNKGENQEGSKIDLIKARVQEFSESCVFVGGTPTAVGECTVSEEYAKSDQREWYMPHPCCGHVGEFVTDVREVKRSERHVPHGPGLRYVVGRTGYPVRVWYECKGCGARIWERSKIPMMEAGHFVVTNSNGEPGHVGVRSWMIHSQDPKATWLDIAKAHQAAQNHPDKLQSFTNLFLARAWSPPVAKTISVVDLKKKVAFGLNGKLPRHVRFLFAGIDGQRGSDDGTKPGRMEIVVIAVGENMRFHVVAHHVVDHEETVSRTTDEIVRSPVKPFSPEARPIVMELLDRVYETEDGRSLRIMQTCCDVGYEMTQATGFVRSISTPARPVVPVRGASDAAGRVPPIGKDREHRSFLFHTGVLVQKLGTASIKDYLYDTLTFPTPGPQSWSFPEGMPDEFWIDLLAEHLVETKSGKTVWKRRDKSVTGEVWDCVVYAYAAHLMLREWSGDWAANVMIPQIRIRPEAVEASLIAEAERVHSEALAEKAPARPAPTPPPAPAPDTVEETIVEAVQRRLDAMFETIEDDDGPAFEIVRRQPIRPPTEPEPDENPFIIAGRR